MTEHPTPIDKPREAEPNAGQAATRGGWLNALVGIVSSPRTSFEIIRRRTPWVGAFLVLLAGTVSLATLSIPFGLQVMRAQFTEVLHGDAEQVDAMMAQFEQAAAATRLVTIGTGAAMLMVVLLLQAMFVWLLAVAFQGRPRFVQALSLVVHVNVIAHLQKWANFALLRLRGLDAIQSPQDAQPAMGLDLLLAGDNAALNVVWASVNPFTIWFVALLGFGAATVLGLSQRKGLVLAGAYWAATTAFAAASVAVAARLTPM